MWTMGAVKSVGNQLKRPSDGFQCYQRTNPPRNILENKKERRQKVEVGISCFGTKIGLMRHRQFVGESVDKLVSQRAVRFSGVSANLF